MYNKSKDIYIIGGGISGCLTAIELSKYKHLNIHLFEKENDLLTGSPFCHLHAGGMLYPMISIEESKQLLYDSLEFAQMFNDCLERRPTIIAYNKNTKYDIRKLILKCKTMKYYYSVWSNNNNNLLPLGSIDNYFETYTKEDILNFKHGNLHKNNFHDPYIKTFSKLIKNIDDIQYPIVSVKEYGINLDLIKTKIKLLIKNNKQISLYTNTQITNLNNFDNNIIINATGYNINSIYNSFENKDYFLEIKSSWIIKNKTIHNFPEIAIIGERNTPNGMLQITPQNDNCYQIHSMKNDITLFQNGCIFSDNINEFYKEFKDVCETKKFNDEIIISRTSKAIKEVQKLLYDFENSEIVMNPLWGIQRIPGIINSNRNWNLLKNKNYIEIHLVKGISGVCVSKKIANII